MDDVLIILISNNNDCSLAMFLLTLSNFLKKLPRLGVLALGFSFVAGVFLFGFAYFTVSIQDPNDYVNSQSTIIQY